MSAFVDPVPGGTVGRADQGVDISAPPGTPVRNPVPGTSVLVGTIPNWYLNQSFYWFKVTSGPFKGRYWYVAEQVQLSVSQGQQINQGQQIGVIAPTGTGTEWGWATSSGQTLARATTGYTEGQATAAGVNFRNLVLGATNQALPAGTSGYGGSRPGGSGSGPGGSSSGQAVDQLLTEYVALRDAPRTDPNTAAGSPVPLGASVGWWFAQFQTLALKVFGG